MFSDHTMTIVTDLNIVANEIQSPDYYIVAAITTSEIPKAPNIFYAGILVPPTDMLMAWADGNMDVIHNYYPQYLQTQDCDDMLVAIISAMIRRNVILYIPQDEFDIFGMDFLTYLYNMYGIVCNSPTTNFWMDVNKLPLLMSKFYMMDIIDGITYMQMYPYNVMLPDFVINKLAYDFNPFNGRQAYFEEYKNYFNQLISLKVPRSQNNKILLTIPVKKE